MLSFAAASALETTIVYVLIWGVLFPVFVQGMIAYAIVVGRGERESNDEDRRYPRL